MDEGVLPCAAGEGVLHDCTWEEEARSGERGCMAEWSMASVEIAGWVHGGEAAGLAEEEYGGDAWCRGVSEMSTAELGRGQ